MADACCGGPPPSAPDEDGANTVQWRAPAAVIAALAWLVGVIAGLNDLGALADGAFISALVVGGATFVPGALAALARRRLGVGLLMTVAAIGATVLGHDVIELATGIMLGCGIGYGLDVLFGTLPVLLIIFSLLGFGAGVRVMMGTAREMAKADAGKPATTERD